MEGKLNGVEDDNIRDEECEEKSVERAEWTQEIKNREWNDGVDRERRRMGFGFKESRGPGEME